MILFILLFLLFTILNWLDFYLTKKGLEVSLVEFNPILKLFGLLWPKIIGNIIFGLFGWFVSWGALIPPIILMAGICVWDLIQIRRIK